MSNMLYISSALQAWRFKGQQRFQLLLFSLMMSSSLYKNSACACVAHAFFKPCDVNET